MSVALEKRTSERLLPHVFAAGFLGLQVYAWQAKVMLDVWQGKKTLCRTPNGAGKTSNIVAPIALAVAHEWPGATVVLTSATFPQLKEQIFNAIHQHEEKFPGWTFNETEIESPNGSRIIGRATDRGGRFEGWHAYPDRPLLIIADEAKSIPDDIKVAIDRCAATMFLGISSPGGQAGWFYEGFSKPHIYSCHAITLRDCPHLADDHERLNELRELYGEDSEIYRSMVLGEFGGGDDDGMVIPLSVWEACHRKPPQFKPGERRAFADFAEGGGDENVLALREGNKITIVDAWTQTDGNRDAILMRFHRLFKQLGDCELYGDEGGLGRGMIFALQQLGHNIQPVNNGARANDAHYFNTAAEMWFHLRREMEEGRIILPDDPTLKSQLLSRRKHGWVKSATGEKFVGREDGVLQLEPKRQARGKSPDRADAVVGAAWPNALSGRRNLIKGRDIWEDRLMESEAVGTELAGFNTGW